MPSVLVRVWTNTLLNRIHTDLTHLFLISAIDIKL
jgi:hypothetical protein